MCSGKVYFDLYEEREKRGVNDVYLLRVEQLYPLPMKALVHELSRFKQAEMVWCQEEPRNMGAWLFVEPYLEWVLNQVGATQKRARYAGRPASAATAVGVMSKHLAQLKQLLRRGVGVAHAESSGRLVEERGKSTMAEIRVPDAWRIRHRGDHRQMVQEARRCRSRSTSRWSSSKPTR